jgi:FAD/FMN-containing dehydrogenase
VLWGEFDAATQAHGLHTPGGRVTTTGLGGFTTGGGYGWTSSKFGLACDNLISAEVVLADGSVVRASEREHADLFWGIRGGGGNFGIVTEFEFRLHPLGPIVLAGLAMFPIDRAPDVLRRWRDWADAAPDELSTGCAVILAPPEEFVPPELRGQPVLGIPVLYVGDPEAGAAAVQPLKDLGPAVDHIGPMPYTAFQAALDPLAPWDLGGFYARGEYLPELSDAAAVRSATLARSRRGGHRGAVPARGARRGAGRGRLGAGCRARRTGRPGGAHWRARHRQDPAGRGGG